jgi:hypothetical protein
MAEYGSVDENWRTFAVCLSMPVELFFPPDAIDGRCLPKSYYDEAKSLCVQCPVRTTCLERGMDEEFGVWGGLTRAERKRLKETGSSQINRKVSVIQPRQPSDVQPVKIANLQ